MHRMLGWLIVLGLVVPAAAQADWAPANGFALDGPGMVGAPTVTKDATLSYVGYLAPSSELRVQGPDDDGNWVRFGGALNPTPVTAIGGEGTPQFTNDDGRLDMAWSQDGADHFVTWDGFGWNEPADHEPFGTVDRISWVADGADGDTIVAWVAESSMGARRIRMAYDHAGWEHVPDIALADPADTVTDLSVTSVEGVRWVSWREVGGVVARLHVVSLDPETNMWGPVGGALGTTPTLPTLVETHQGDGALAYYEGGNLIVRQWDGSAWTQLGGTLNTDPAATHDRPSLTRGAYLAFSELGTTVREVKVLHWDGSQWNAVGGSLNHDAGVDASQPDIDGVGGGPTVAWLEGGSIYAASHEAVATVPAAPVLTGTNHDEDTDDDNHPLVLGSAEAGTTVTLFSDPDCTTAAIGSGTAEALAAGGIAITVGDDTITHIYATASNDDGDSACSQSTITYEEISTAGRWHVTVGSAAASVPEAGGAATVTISRDGVPNGTARVHYATVAGTAGPGDFGAVSGTMKFSPGVTSRTVPVPITQDDLHEGDESFALTLSSPGLGTALGTPSSETITIADDDLIETVITSGPSGPTNHASPAFAFTADPPAGATFACSVDGGAESVCTSPFSAPLADGPHTFSVAAASAGGAADATPAQRSFFVDTVVPGAALELLATPGTGASVRPGVFTGSVSVRGTASDADPSTGIDVVGCAIDLPGLATPDAVRAGSCPPVTAVGDHVAYAVGVDKAGNVGPVASATFSIVASPDTTITSGPDGRTWTTTPTFTFVSTVPGSTFRCQVDGDDPIPCASPYRILPGVSGSGAHSVTVTAVSPQGVADPTPARREFRVADTETHDFSCGLDGFAVEPAAAEEHHGCTIEPAGQPCSGLYPSCQSVVPACPVGALCRYDLRVEGTDQDFHVNFLTNVYVVERITPEIRADHGFAYGKAGMLAFVACFHYDPTKDGDTRPSTCPQTGTNTALGHGSAPSFLCPTRNGANYSGGLNPALGPDSARHTRCQVKMTIQAAATLVTVYTADGLSTYAPGPGTVAVAPGGPRARVATIAAAHPLFRKAAKRVKRAGAVTFKLKLGRAAKKALKRTRKLSLRVRLSFKPRQGKTVTRTHTVVIRRPRAATALP